MGFFGFGRESGASAREQAAKAMEQQKMEKMMQEHALGDAYKAEMAKGAAPEEKAYPREPSREFSLTQMEGAGEADRMMEYYKQDPDLAAAFQKDPNAATALRDALAEKAGSGAGQAELAALGASLIEERFPQPVVEGTPMEEPEVVVGIPVEGEEKAA